MLAIRFLAEVQVQAQFLITIKEVSGLRVAWFQNQFQGRYSLWASSMISIGSL